MTGSAIRVRAAAAEDGEHIGEAHAASWEVAYASILDTDFVARAAAGRRQRWPTALVELLDSGALVLVVERGATVVGFAHAGPESQQRPLAEIYGFYTHPDVWGTGAASELMSETCSALAADFTEVVLWTLRDAGRARRFYEKVGFATTGAERGERLSDWTTRDVVEPITVEYQRTLRTSA